MTETLANRRIFRSKVDSIRPTYGFEDVSLAPGTDTADPRGRGPGAGLLRHPPRDPGPRRRHGCRRGRALLRRAGASRRSRVPQPGRRPVPLRRPGRGPGPDHRRPRRSGAGRPGRGLRRPDPRGADRPPYRGAPRRRLQGRRLGDARRGAHVRAPVRGPRRGPLPAPVRRSPPRATSPAATSPLSLADFTRSMPIPVAVGNTTNAAAAFMLMEQGAAAIFVASAPARPARPARSLGIGVPQVTAIATSPPPGTSTAPRPAGTSRLSPTAA